MIRSTPRARRRHPGRVVRPASPAPWATGDRVRHGLLAVLLVLAAAACGPGDAPAAAPAPDPAVKPYCDAVARAQTEQSAPGANDGGVAAVSAATRRRLADLVRTAPPEIAGEWRSIQFLTNRSLGFFANSGGDPRRLDRGALEKLRRAGEPAQERIRTVTQQRCGIALRTPG